MFAVIVIVGGLLLGLFAPRRAATIATATLYIAAAAFLVATAPADHGAIQAIELLPAAAVALGVGMWIHTRRTTHAHNLQDTSSSEIPRP